MQTLKPPIAAGPAAVAPVVGLLGPNSGQRMIAVIAALFGVLLTGFTCSLIPIPITGLPLMMGAVGSVSVLLYVVPASPFAQPWAIIGGNVVSASVGVAAAHLIPYPILAAAVAVSGAILAMSALRCVHPPGGASALAGVMGGPALAAAGWAYPAVLFVDCSILVLAALVIHAVIGNRYPAPAAAPAPAPVIDLKALDLSARQAVAAATEPGVQSSASGLPIPSKVVLMIVAALGALSVATLGATRYFLADGMDPAAITWRIALVCGAVTLLAAAMCRSMVRGMMTPLARLSASVDALAQGRNDIGIDDMGRADEIGAIARSVALLRDQAGANIATGASLRAVIQDIGDCFRQLAQRDLSVRMHARYPAEYRQIGIDFNAVVVDFDTAMSRIGDRSADIRDGIRELAGASDALAHQTERSAGTLDETSTVLENVTGQVSRNADQAGQATCVVKAVEDETIAGGAVVRKAIEAMQDIRQSTALIAQVTALIDDLAFQTNLLALNAAIEAGHAGHSGRGFAVIAEEVRRLAQRSAHAAHEIKELVATSTAQVEIGVKLVDGTGGALTRIATQVEAIGGLVSTVAESARDQAGDLRTINDTIGGIVRATKANVANVEQHTIATHELAMRTGTLDDLLDAFQRCPVDGKGGSVAHDRSHGMAADRVAA